MGMDGQLREGLKALLLEALKGDITGTTSGAQVAHGPGYDGLPTAGIFSSPTARQDIYSAVPRPATAASALLLNAPDGGVNPEYRSEFDILTGISEGTGTNPTDWCGTPPRAGLARLCTHSAIFGKFMMATNPLAAPQVGLRVNSGDRDREFRNLATASPFVPDILQRMVNLNDQTGLMFYILGLEIERQVEQVVFQGNRANPATGAGSFRGFMSQFDGLDREIRTGRTDAVTGEACGNADSLVYTFSDANIDGGTGTVGDATGKNIAQILSELHFRLSYRAMQQGLAPAQLAFIMHPDHFYALTRVYPCQYYTTGCTVTEADGARLNLSAEFMRQQQDAMFGGKFIPVNGGERVPVILSTGMAETASENGFSRTIYCVPLTVLGGIPVTYLEGFNMANNSMMALLQTVPPNELQLMNGGLYLMTFNRTNACVEYIANAMLRLVMRTPQLAGRVDAVYANMVNSDPGLPGYSLYQASGRTFLSAETLAG